VPVICQRCHRVVPHDAIAIHFDIAKKFRRALQLGIEVPLRAVMPSPVVLRNAALHRAPSSTVMPFVPLSLALQPLPGPTVIRATLLRVAVLHDGLQREIPVALLARRIRESSLCQAMTVMPADASRRWRRHRSVLPESMRAPGHRATIHWHW
jgi:hypothetical protein